MGESTEKSRGALAAHQPTIAPTKPIQKIAPTIQVNKENAAPNSVQSTSTRSASRGLAARPAESHHGLSSGSSHTSSTRKSDLHGAVHQSQFKEDSHQKAGTNQIGLEVPLSASKPSRGIESSTQKEPQVVQDIQLSALELETKSQAVYDYLTTKTPFKDDVSKWLDYLRAYCEKRSYGTDVLRGVLNRSLQGKPEWQKSEKYFELWRYWALRLAPEDQHDAFKMIEKYSIGLQMSTLYVHLATLKLDQRDWSGALKVLENGQARGAEPSRDLDIFIDKIRASQQRSTATSTREHQYHSGSISAALTPSIPPSTPQHAIHQHMDCDNTPSTIQSQAKGPAATKPRSVSTPSTFSGSNGQFEASTPSPTTTDSSNLTATASASLSTSSTSAAAAKADAAKRRSSASTLGGRTGLRGGAMRVPKATSASPAAPATPASQLAPSSLETLTEDATIAPAASNLAPIQEDSAMQVDEHFSTQGTENMMQLDHKTQLESALTGKTGHMTGSSSTTNGYCTTGGAVTSSSTSSSSSSISSAIPIASHTQTSNPPSSTSAVAMRQLAQAIPSRMAPPAQASAASIAPIASNKSENSSHMAISEPFVAPVAPSSSVSQTASKALPAPVTAYPSQTVAPSIEERSQVDQVMESAQAAAKALGRELFIVRGKPYINLQAIGKGGTCSVYKVMDPKGNIWALKVITWTAETVEVVKGYNDEVKLLELVQGSPYVVKLIEHELVATSNTMYIMFEFAETDLRRLFVPLKQDPNVAKIIPGGRFGTDLDALRYYWRSMLSAVLVLHKQRIVHLDLKPANFVLVEGRVKIIDFGIAKKVLNDTMHAKVEDIAGTILYMAPETLRQPAGRMPHKVGFPADVWSMGCILFQMVYGYTPFEHVSGLMPKIAAITAADPIQLQPVDNEDLMDCLRLCLDKSFEHRPTIADLLNHPFLGGCLQWSQS